MQKGFFKIIALSLTLWLVGCGAASDEPQGKNILLWHGWSVPEAVGLTQLVNNFTTLHPEVRVIISAIPPDQLRSQYIDNVSLGLGPDVIIGPSDWVRELADPGLIRNLNQQSDQLNKDRYLSAAVDTLRYEDGLYGLPFTISTVALYFNKSLTDIVPESLDQLLLEAAEQGKKIAINTSFDEAFWGVQAFGGRLFAEGAGTGGRIMLDQGGFANWLSWLKQAQDQPNVLLDRDDQTLYELFLEGQATYYVGKPDRLDGLQEALGQENVGVARLPDGPNGPSGPFLRTEAFMFNPWSSEAHFKQALQLAEFLTSVEQQTKLARQDIPKVPTNLRVRVDPEVYPAINGFIAQSKTTIPVLNLTQLDDVLAYGNDSYIEALAGVIEPGEAARNLTERVNEQHGFGLIQTLTEVNCSTGLEGTVQLWHGLSGTKERALQEAINSFSERCPDILINSTAIDPDQLYDQYRDQIGRDQGPTLLLGSSEWIGSLASNDLISDMTGLVNPEQLQQYEASVTSAVRYQQRLYSLPVSMDLMALYYKSDKVEDLPRTMDDLLLQAKPNQQIVLPISFKDAFWGMFAFGGITFNEDYQPRLKQDSVVAWLNWLKMAQERTAVHLDFDQTESLELFAADEAVYLVAQSSRLSELQQMIGAGRLRVIALPAGPANEAAPFVIAQGLMLNPAASENEVKLAIEFGQHLASPQSQTLLMEQGNIIPINVNVQLQDYPAIAGFIEQARSAIPMPSQPEIDLIWNAGDALYEQVLLENEDPVEAVQELIDLVEKNQSKPIPQN